MNSKNELNYKLNDKGLSLVELIVAISIGVIVSASIAALLTFSIRMYRNESVNTSMQYELQTNLNMMMDEIMGASTMVVEQNTGVALTDTGKPYTKFAMFGKVTGSSTKKFTGVIFVSSSADSDNKFKIYMNRINDEVVPVADTNPYPGALQTFANTQYGIVSGAFATDPNPYLLGENATQFIIQPDPDAHSLDATEKTYTNPIEVKVELQFERNGWGTKKYSKHVDDLTYLRNKVKDSIYIKNPTDPSFIEFKIKEKKD